MKIFKQVVAAAETHMRVDQFISHHTLESRELIKQQASAILVNQQRVKPSYKLKENDIVTWEYSPIVKYQPKLIGENIPLDIIFEDEHLMVLNKPAGMVVHPAKGHWEGTLSHAIAYHLQLENTDELRPGIVHRLDKDTSGLMVVAKTYQAQKGLMKAFQKREILKIYTALVQGKLITAHDIIEYPIGRSKKNRLLFAVDPIAGKEALTEYQVIKELPKVSLLKIRIHTGRTHQIRAHLTHIGHPLIGDILYARSYKEFSLCLVATKLGFLHPITQEKMIFEIPLPLDFQNVLRIFND